MRNAMLTTNASSSCRVSTAEALGSSRGKAQFRPNRMVRAMNSGTGPTPAEKERPMAKARMAAPAAATLTMRKRAARGFCCIVYCQATAYQEFPYHEFPYQLLPYHEFPYQEFPAQVVLYQLF